MLDKIGAVADDPRDEGGAFGELHFFEDPPFVLVARVRRLDQIAPRTHAEDQVDDVLERNVVMVRAVKAAPGHMQSDLLFRNVAQRVAQCVDARAALRRFKDGRSGTG